jgi:Na+-transporting NADH:ubiquinone oxidoreductase subunit F
MSRYTNSFVRAGGAGTRAQKTYLFRVVSNCNVATFIRELVLEPAEAEERIVFTPGELPTA